MNNYRDINLQHHYRQCSPNWTTERVTSAFMADNYYAYDKEACKRACTRMITSLLFSRDAYNTSSSDLALDYVGNTELLKNPNRVSLICHHADGHLFELQTEKVLESAKKGSIVVSAFVSNNEREIKRLLLEQHFPFVEVLSFGITPNYHPMGGAYEACADGILVQISPWDGRMPFGRLTRDKCIVMNELVRTITHKKDYWWKNVAK